MRDFMNVAVAAVACLGGVAAGDIAIAYRNGLELPAATTDQFGQSFTITGLSGLTALPDGRFATVMDNSNKVVFFRPAFNADGGLASVSQVTGLTLLQTRDFEDIAFLPSTNSALLSDEGVSGPLSVVDLATGALTAGPAVPAVYAGIRANFGLESVTVSPDGLTAWTCNEEALTADGPLSTSAAGSRVRLQRFSRAAVSGTGGFAPSGQWCYVTQSMHGPAITGSRSGVSALVALPGGELLAMERSLAGSPSGLFLTRIYSVSTLGATDVGSAPVLPVPGMAACGKTSRFAMSLNNVEGLALGPAVAAGVGVPYGRRILLAITDDADAFSTNRLHALVIDGLMSSCGAADLGSQGGVVAPDGDLDNNDFIVFIDKFFQHDAGADLGSQGGVGPGDGQFDNNDFVVFIDLFFAGC
jgi:hypothetical protein